MSEIRSLSLQFNTFDQPRPAFVTAAGTIYRPSGQGGIRRCTPLDLALMSGTGTVVCWRIGTVRQEVANG
jgi:hypothetical protein